jgi:hypothetical protein
LQKSFPAHLEAVARQKALPCDTIEIWFAGEARIGQKNKNKITDHWATRLSGPRDQRTAFTSIRSVGELCAKVGDGMKG